MKTITVMRDGRPATADELQCAVEGKPLPPLTGYAAWVLIVRQGKEPIVKRCNTDDEKRRMMTDCRNQFPMSQIISLQTNPGDPKELWAESLVNYMATVNAA